MESAEGLSESVIARHSGRPGVTGAVWTTLRQFLYVILMLLRVPLQLITRLVSFPLVFFGLFWGFAAGWDSPACLWMVGTGVGLCVVGFLFDTVLLLVSPERLYLES